MGPTAAAVLAFGFASAVAVASPDAAKPTLAPSEASGDVWPTGASVVAAVVVHRGSKARLAVADLVKGTFDDVGAPGEEADAAWSANGARLGYRSGSAVYVLRPGSGPAVRVRDGVLPARKARRPFAFSPDGRRIAIATDRGLEVVSFDGPPAASPTRGPALWLSDLTWSADGKQLAACRWDERPKQPMQGSIVIATIADDGVRVRTLPGEAPACEVLGLREGDWLVKKRDDDSGIEEVLTVSATGRAKRLLRAPAESFVIGYLADFGAVVEAEGVEDEGDPTRLALAPLSGAKATPWLRGARKLRQLIGSPRSAGGGFVLVTVRQAPGQAGSIDIVSRDGKSVRQVLPAPGAASGKIWFSAPIPRPLPGARP